MSVRRPFMSGLCVLALVAIQMNLFLAPGIAATKVNSSCKKIGQKTKIGSETLKCVRVGQKKVWKLIAASPSTSPSQTASAVPAPINAQSFTPWSETTSGTLIISASITRFNDWFKALQPSDNPHQLILDPELSYEWVSMLKKVDLVSAQTFDRYIKRPTFSFGARECQWIRDQIDRFTAEEIRKTYSRCPIDPYGRSTNHLNSFNAVGVATGTLSNDPTFPNIAAANFAHEYMHNAQNQLMGGSGLHYSRTPAPAWLLEGSANFFGFLIACHALEESCLSMESYGMRGSEIPSSFTNQLKDYENKELTSLPHDDPRFLNAYPIGFRAVEFIVASCGPEAIFDIFRNLRTGLTFSDAFERATGVTVESFYSKFEKVRISFGIPRATMQVVSGMNVPKTP